MIICTEQLYLFTNKYTSVNDCDYNNIYDHSVSVLKMHTSKTSLYRYIFFHNIMYKYE